MLRRIATHAAVLSLAVFLSGSIHRTYAQQTVGKQTAGADQPSELYVSHCQVCHGVSGDGRGRAARYLFPKPRDFGRQQFRIVTTANYVASDEDIARTIRRGMPGTAMRAFGSLSEKQIATLVQDVRQLRRNGIRRKLTQAARADGEQEAIAESLVRRLSEPGSKVPVPPPSAAAAIERGRAVYLKYSCHQCHGDEGRGVADQIQFDRLGYPVFPRDLVSEPLKGGDSLADIFYRVKLGSGNAMPRAHATDRELIDLAEYVQSLGQEPKRQLTNHQRAARAAGVSID